MSNRDSTQTLWTTFGAALAGHEIDLAPHAEADILAQGDEHGVLPLLDRAHRSGRVRGVSAHVIEKLAEASRDHAALDLLLQAGTRKTLALLAAQGIDALLLKGLPLACLYYPESRLRPRLDTDVFIRAADVARAAEILRQNEYWVTGTDTGKPTSKQFGASVGFQGQRLHMDIHWALSNRPMFRETLTFEGCFERRQPVPELGEHAFTPAAIDLLLHACIHRIAHGRNTERNRLIWLYDIHLLLGAMDGQQQAAFQATALQRRVGALCADALVVCAALFGTQLPHGFIRELQRNADVEPSGGLIHASKTRWAWADLASIEGLRAKALYAKDLLLNQVGS